MKDVMKYLTFDIFQIFKEGRLSFRISKINNVKMLKTAPKMGGSYIKTDTTIRQNVIGNDTNITGPYNRGYLAALHFFPRNTSRDTKLTKIIYHGCCVSRLPRITIWRLYRGCRMAPQQVKFRLPRRRDLPAIIRSRI